MLPGATMPAQLGQVKGLAVVGLVLGMHGPPLSPKMHGPVAELMIVAPPVFHSLSRSNINHRSRQSIIFLQHDPRPPPPPPPPTCPPWPLLALLMRRRHNPQPPRNSQLLRRISGAPTLPVQWAGGSTLPHPTPPPQPPQPPPLPLYTQVYLPTHTHYHPLLHSFSVHSV